MIRFSNAQAGFGSGYGCTGFRIGAGVRVNVRVWNKARNLLYKSPV